MAQLIKALHAWNTSAFKETLKHEIEHLDVNTLPLQQGLSQGNYASDANLGVIVMSVSDEVEFIRAKTGIFYTSIISGCSCADDPTPISELTEYCEVLFDIDKKTAEAKVTLLTD
jgi:hypothetical protein